MSHPKVHLTVENGIALITLDHPPVNSVALETTRMIDAHLTAIEADPAVRAVVFTGAGQRAFCAGSDISEFPRLAAAQEIVSTKLDFENRTYSRVAHLARPTVAAVEGLALGGGLELAVCCDYIVCSDQSRLGLPEIKIAAFPASAGTLRVTRRVGVGRAKEMMLLGEFLDAQTALAWGLVNRVAPAGQVLGEAMKVARRFADGPLNSHLMCRRAIDSAFNMTEDEAIAQNLRFSEALSRREDFREGARAFFAKEKPRYAEVPHRLP
ncbi:MAG: enoyl-CoA hydratase-related protein [Rubrivivax sp.]